MELSLSGGGSHPTSTSNCGLCLRRSCCIYAELIIPSLEEALSILTIPLAHGHPTDGFVDYIFAIGTPLGRLLDRPQSLQPLDSALAIMMVAETWVMTICLLLAGTDVEQGAMR